MAENQAPHRAGLFDIRFIIGALIGLYGLIILVTGFFTSDAQVQKSDGLNINIWAGIVGTAPADRRTRGGGAPRRGPAPRPLTAPARRGSTCGRR
jgi:hypothetical protein